MNVDGNSKKRLNIIKNHLNSEKEYTLAEVNKHNKEDDCWVVLWDGVYDVTKFLSEHPGGKPAIMLYAGKDATEEFDMMHQPSVMQKYGPGLKIGKYKK